MEEIAENHSCSVAEVAFGMGPFAGGYYKHNHREKIWISLSLTFNQQNMTWMKTICIDWMRSKKLTRVIPSGLLNGKGQIESQPLLKYQIESTMIS